MTQKVKGKTYNEIASKIKTLEGCVALLKEEGFVEELIRTTVSLPKGNLEQSLDVVIDFLQTSSCSFVDDSNYNLMCEKKKN